MSTRNKTQLEGTVRSARRIGVSTQYVRYLADRGTLPVAHRTIDGRRFFNVAVIERFAKARSMKKGQVAVNR